MVILRVSLLGSWRRTSIGASLGPCRPESDRRTLESAAPKTQLLLPNKAHTADRVIERTQDKGRLAGRLFADLADEHCC